MSGTYTLLWAYVLATVVGGIVAALLHKYVIAPVIAPAVERGEQPFEDDPARPYARHGRGVGWT